MKHCRIYAKDAYGGHIFVGEIENAYLNITLESAMEALGYRARLSKNCEYMIYSDGDESYRDDKLEIVWEE